ncbi:hypothetical protein QBC32DRAFT_270578 [Pseudoneurospora amorphoporcata]|uniref:Uncharacterized protein n=1 Tax=Pseudoneurospora amorphoporcata TaxID=241081 RepID=A0AAN6NMG4_9PEZI|nr:hypothetical protein QBC32DRAFT_270578 [Pseudoneurospora amorphoporcata]
MVAGNVEQRLDPGDWVVWVDPRQIRQLFKQRPRTGHGGEQLLGYDLDLERRRTGNRRLKKRIPKC